MTPVEVLRAAAADMRTKAQAATPGPWHVPRRGTGIDAGDYDTVIGPGDVDCMSRCYGGTSTIEGDRLAHDQAHIASWHPAVALAVADWLDRHVHAFAVMAVQYPDIPYPYDRDTLAVARAHLGQAS